MDAMVQQTVQLALGEKAGSHLLGNSPSIPGVKSVGMTAKPKPMATTGPTTRSVSMGMPKMAEDGPIQFNWAKSGPSPSNLPQQLGHQLGQAGQEFGNALQQGAEGLRTQLNHITGAPPQNAWEAFKGELTPSHPIAAAMGRNTLADKYMAMPAWARYGIPAAGAGALGMYMLSGRNRDEEKAAAFGEQMGKQAVNLDAAGKAGPFDSQLAARVSGLDKTIAATERNRHEHPWHYYLNPMVPGPLGEMVMRAQRRAAASRASGKLPLAAGFAGDVAGDVASRALTAPFLGGSGAGGLLPLGSIGNTAHGGTAKKVEARQAHEATSMPYHEAEEDAAVAGARAKAKTEKAAAGGPFDVALGGQISNQDDQIAAMEQNRHEHPWHYYLNPFVPGPISELMTRYSRRINAGMHDSWPGTLSAIPTLGIAPALMGGEEAKTRAREDYKTHAGKYEEGPADNAEMEVRQQARQKRPIAKAASALSAKQFGEQMGKLAASMCCKPTAKKYKKTAPAPYPKSR